MILLSIPEVKEFMSKLLLSETFDTFLFVEGEIVTFNTFTMNGRLQKEGSQQKIMTEFVEVSWENHNRISCCNGRNSVEKRRK